jgi:hypothetical protein
MSWAIVWVAWLLIIVATFAALETFALEKKQWTLSRFVWETSAKFPAFPWIAGFITGFLVCHFWWGGIVGFAPV